MLSQAIPEEEILAIFPSARTVLLANTVSRWREVRSQDVPSTLMYVWDRMVHRGETTDPYKVSDIVNNDYEGLYEFVETELGGPPLREALAVEFFNDISNDPFASLSLVRTHGNELHIADIELSDNRHPVQSETRTHRGLHIFSRVLDRLKSVARTNGDTQISLVAASRHAHAAFSRHGFEVGPTEFDQRGFTLLGQGHGMVYPLADETDSQ